MIDDLLRAVIIEDEPESLNLLHNLINSTNHARVSGFTTDPAKAVNLIMSKDPDILFLDIRMPGKSGFDILDELRKENSSLPFIVFTTAYDEYAIKAFEYAAFDYLLKPVDPERLEKALLRCVTSRKTGDLQKADILLNSHRKLIYRDLSGFVVIDPSDIIFVEARGNYSVFNLASGRMETITSLLGDIEKRLPEENFFRTGRSNIINLSLLRKINSVRGVCILEKNGKEYVCEISHEKVKILARLMKNMG